MSSLKKLLVPIDFSNAADVALNYAAHFCEDSSDKEVTLIHVRDESSGISEEEILSRLEELKKKFGEHSKAKCEVLSKTGQLNDIIIGIRKEMGHDLIVMGTKGSKEEEEVAITNTSSLVKEADAPVLVIPEAYDSFSINNIALALGKGEIDDSFALGVLHDIARAYNAKVHILTIETEDDNGMIGEDKNESILEYYLETLDYRHSFPKNSDIEVGISDYAKQKNIDMLAILPRNHAKKSKPSEGRLTKLLTLHAEIPVLTID